MDDDGDGDDAERVDMQNLFLPYSEQAGSHESQKFPCALIFQGLLSQTRVNCRQVKKFLEMAILFNRRGPTIQHGCPIRFEGLWSPIVILSTKVDKSIRAVAALATPEITIHPDT